MLKSYKNNFINIHQMRQKQLTPAVLTDVRIPLFVCFGFATGWPLIG